MSILERQLKERGDRCKWLTCDSWCHYNSCILNMARQDFLFDKFRELNFKYPEVYAEIGSSGCTMCENEYVKIGDFKDDYDEENDVTLSEAEALKIAETEFKDDEYVKKLYFELKDKYRKRKEQELEKMADELEKMENDEIEENI